MGGFSRRRSSGLAGFEMIRAFRLLAYLAIGLLLGGSATFAFAGYAQLKAPVNIGGTVGNRATAGSFASNNGNVSVGFTTQVAGQNVTMPAIMRFAANVGQFAVTAVRGSPGVLLGTAVLAWLAQEGINYVNGQFVKNVDPAGQIGGGFDFSCGGYVGPITAAAAQTCAAIGGWGTISEIEYIEQTPGSPTTGYLIRAKSSKFAGGPWGVAVFSYRPTCPAGTTNNGTQCVGAAVPAGQADWDAVAAKPLPEAVKQELAGKGVPLPLQNPEFDPIPQTVPLSNPYPKPGGQPGETVRDVAKVTPAPNEQVKIEPVVEPVTGPNGDPITPTNPDGSTNPDAASEEKPDFCIENPDALACWKEGEPENAELEKVTAGTSITPVNIGGGGSCPDSKTVNYMGANLVISFTPICTAAGWIHPIVIALAWLSAGFILVGAFKQG